MVSLYLLAPMFYLVAAAPETSEKLRLRNAHDRGSRIAGGVDAAPGEFPHQVSMYLDGGFFCGGSLIEADKVLTAAQCCYGFSTREITVKVGDYRLFEGKEIKVSKIIVHEGFDLEYDYYNYDPNEPNNYENDICLLFLSEKADNSSSSVGFIELPEKNTEYSPGDQCTVIGWGATDSDPSFSSTVLQKVTVPVISDADCKQYYGEDVFPSMICAGGQKGSCWGDAGGAMICNRGKTKYLDGIVSSTYNDGFDYRCGQSKKPGVYTQTSYFVDWIQKHSHSGSSHHGCSIVMLVTTTCLIIWKQFL